MAGACCWRRIAWTGPTPLGARGAYGKIIRVELLHKLHDELKYDSLDALTRDTPGLRRCARLVCRANLTGPGARKTSHRVPGPACPLPCRAFAL